MDSKAEFDSSIENIPGFGFGMPQVNSRSPSLLRSNSGLYPRLEVDGYTSGNMSSVGPMLNRQVSQEEDMGNVGVGTTGNMAVIRPFVLSNTTETTRLDMNPPVNQSHIHTMSHITHQTPFPNQPPSANQTPHTSRSNFNNQTPLTSQPPSAAATPLLNRTNFTSRAQSFNQRPFARQPTSNNQTPVVNRSQHRVNPSPSVNRSPSYRDPSTRQRMVVQRNDSRGSGNPDVVRWLNTGSTSGTNIGFSEDERGSDVETMEIDGKQRKVRTVMIYRGRSKGKYDTNGDIERY